MVSELILAFVFFAPLGIVLVELLGGAADSLIDKGEKEKEHNAFMLKQEHTIGFCDGVMCVTKILENEKRDDGNKPYALTNGEGKRELIMEAQIQDEGKIKSEAYKEFAERVKDIAFPLLPNDTARDGFSLHLSNLLNEMVGTVGKKMTCKPGDKVYVFYVFQDLGRPVGIVKRGVVHIVDEANDYIEVICDGYDAHVYGKLSFGMYVFYSKRSAKRKLKEWKKRRRCNEA